MAQILQIICDAGSESASDLDTARRQLIERARRDTRRFFVEAGEFANVSESLRLSMAWTNDLALNSMWKRCRRRSARRGSSSFSRLQRREQRCVARQVYADGADDIAEAADCVEERVLLFFNSLLGDSGDDVSTLREFCNLHSVAALSVDQRPSARCCVCGMES